VITDQIRLQNAALIAVQMLVQIAVTRRAQIRSQSRRHATNSDTQAVV